MVEPVLAVQEDHLLQLQDRLARAAGARRISRRYPSLCPISTRPVATARATATIVARAMARVKTGLDRSLDPYAAMTAWGFS